MGLIRLLIVGFVGLTVLYVLVSLYSRSIRKEKLEDRWDDKHQDGGDPAERDAYIERGMARYHAGLRRRLILLIYVIPVVAVMAIWWITNSK